MKTIGFALIVWLACTINAGTAYTYETSWNQETTARELCFLFTLYQDWKQTRVIARNPAKYRETNPILGTHPAKQDVDLYFAGCAVGHAFIAYMLPPKASKLWQTTWIGVQSSVIEDNSDLGIRDVAVMEYHIRFSIPF